VAAAAAFDRETDEAVPAEHLASYREALAQYHLHPEAKFLNGDYRDSGHTQRRNIQAIGVTYVGKEANRWEEPFYLGTDEDAAINYGQAPDGRRKAEARIREGISRFGQRAIGRAAHMSLRDISRAARDAAKLSLIQLKRLDQAIARIDRKMNPVS
jgi:hypothetical protein